MTLTITKEIERLWDLECIECDINQASSVLCCITYALDSGNVSSTVAAEALIAVEHQIEKVTEAIGELKKSLAEPAGDETKREENEDYDGK